MKKITKTDRIRGGLLGLLVGDALGVPYEFHQADEIPPLKKIEYTPPKGFQRSHDSIQPGTWSDDGAQALCLLATLLECDTFDAEDYAKRLVMWYDEGYMAVDEIVFDIGFTTGTAIQNLRAGVSALKAGPDGEHDNGNGSLMRVLPLALWHKGSKEELVDFARKQSLVTHGHIRSQICCAIYVLWARNILEEKESPWSGAIATLREMFDTESGFIKEMDYYIRPDEALEGNGSGYVVDSLRSARMVQEENSYEKIVRAAIALGRDTDTTACIAGGIAGLRFGESGIPKRWLKDLRGKMLYYSLLERLVNRIEE